MNGSVARIPICMIKVVGRLVCTTALAGSILAMLVWTDGAGAIENKIELGVPSHGWPPYIIVEQERISGIAIEVIERIGKHRGVSIVIRNYSEKRAHRMVEIGDLDAWFDAKEWCSEPRRFLWTDAIIESEDRLICRKDHPLVFNRVEDLFGKTIGTQLGYFYPRLDNYFDSGSIIRADTLSEAAMLKMLLFGRTDAAVINQQVALWVIRNTPDIHPSDFTFCDHAVDSAGYRIMFTRRRAWAGFIEAFNADLRAMKQDGRLNRIVDAYR